MEVENVVGGFYSCGYLQNCGFVECVVQSYSIILGRAQLECLFVFFDMYVEKWLL